MTVNCVKGTPGGNSGSSGAVGLAATYLDEIAREFGEQYGEQALSATRPFMFMRFDNFLSKTKKIYLNQQQRQLQSGAAAGEAFNNVVANRLGTPNKVSFYKLMGLVEPPGFSGSSSSGGGSNAVSDAKNSLSAFASSLAQTASGGVGAGNGKNKDKMMYIILGVCIVGATLIALWVIMTLFG